MDHVNWAVGKVTRLGITLRVFVYQIDGLLIDTGPHSGLSQLKPFFNEVDVNQIALTHMHEDHSGNANWWWKNKQVPIYVSEKSMESAKKSGKYPYYRKMYWGPRKAFEAKSMPNVLETNKYKFQVIETPGHSDDSVSFYEETNGWLFLGDLYITEKPKLFLREESIPKTIESLKKLSTLDVQYLFCAHNGKFDKGNERIQRKIDYLLELQHNILELHKQGLTKRQIVKKIFPKSSPIIFLSGNEFSSMRAVESIIENI